VTFYPNAAALATRMLSQFGQAGSIRRTTATGGGPASPTGGTVTTTDYPARLALFPVDQSDVDGVLVKAGDWRVVVAPLEIVPTTTDRIVCSEGVLTIVDAGKFAPAGTVTHYRMVARK